MLRDNHWPKMARSISDLDRKCQLSWPVGLPLISLSSTNRSCESKHRVPSVCHTNEGSTNCLPEPFQCFVHVWSRAVERHVTTSPVLFSMKIWKLLSCPNQRTTLKYFDMDMSYARMVRTASLTSYPVRCTILHQRTHSHKWRHTAAGMRAHNVLCNSYYVTVITE
jgi:hypothetical protein